MGELTLDPRGRAGLRTWYSAHSALRGWSRWIVGRALLGFSVVAAVSVIVFLCCQALPSDPARVALGPQATQADVETLRHQFGLDRPIWTQFATWLGDLLRGDLGTSINTGRPVSTLIGDRLINSAVLLLAAIVLAVLVSITTGLLLARRADSTTDHIASTLMIVALAVPDFALGALLIMLLSTNVFAILPATSALDPAQPLLGQANLVVLPALTLAIGVGAYLTRLVRSAAIEQLGSDHIAAARLRGIPESRILFRHVLPNAVIPAIHGLALTTGVLLGGTLAVETIFAYPGVGSELNTAVQQRDFPVIQALVVIIAAIVVIVTLLADLVSALLSPRVRTSMGGTP
ncbi:MAG: ABC transporter permease [Gordonia sp. (in: high G+C Gram-positive bacteria)]